MYNLLITNQTNGFSLDFNNPSSPFIISEILGLDSPDATVNIDEYAVLDGGIFNSAKANYRTLQIAFAIDYDAAIRYFDGYQNMLTAMHSNTGSEHDLNEVFIGKSDAYYAKMSSWIIKELEPEDIHDILAFPAEQKLELFSRLLRATSAPPEQVAKYLRIRLKQEGRDS